MTFQKMGVNLSCSNITLKQEKIMRYIQDLPLDRVHLLERIHNSSRHHQTRQRAQCILLSFRGYTVTQLQGIFQVDRLTIYNWFNAWESLKFVGLYDRAGRGAKPKLTPEEGAQVKAWGKQFPRQLNTIRALVKQHFGKKVSKKTLGRVLKVLRMSWRRVRRRVKGEPGADVYAQKKQELAYLRQQHERGEIDLRYVDQSGFCLFPYLPYAWQEKGHTIAIPSSHSKKRLNVVGFLNVDNAFQAYTFECSLDSAIMIACVDEFCKQVTKRTVLVMDQASIHTSDAFTERIPDWETQGVEIFLLPAYSPELNCIEILWRFIKYYWLEFEAYLSWKHLVEYVEDILRQVGTKYKINFG
jgi:transposase